MINGLNSSSIQSSVCVFLAIQLLNCSIGLTPKFFSHSDQLYHMNFIDTAYELVLEEILGIEDAVPEYGEPVNNETEFVKVMEIDQFISQKSFQSHRTPFTILRYYLRDNAMVHTIQRDPLSPPPEV